MKHYTKTIIILIAAAIFTSCTFWEDDDELSMYRMPYDGTELRIDGYYYEKSTDDYGEERIHVYFFYNNGVLLNGLSMKIEDIERNENNFRNGDFHSHAQKYKHDWGVFQIHGDSISLERWYPDYPVTPAYISIGRILNDTTFYIYKSIRSNGSEKRSEDETYHFKKFDGKPDSTNKFIE
ncbi:MAG: hypothetical protein KAH48_10760 [Chlorobi bacterium]|nr:hypothetical protein [Chlorobiota bacterium]